MSELSHGDLSLARLLSKPPYRRSLYTFFALTATASLYFRVWLGRPEQVLPWYGVALSLYGFGMALVSRDLRCRIVYVAFGVLIAAAFTRTTLEGWTRAVGLIEVLACVALLASMVSLARDGRFLASRERDPLEPDGRPDR